MQPTAALSVLGSLLAACALLASRRLVGAIGTPLPALLLFATAVFLAITIWSVRIVWLSPRGANRFVTWSPLVAVLLAMCAFSWPMARAIDWVIWLPILAGEITCFFRTGLGPMPRSLDSISAKPASDPTTAPADSSDQILQQLTRLRDESGVESLFGTLRAEFAPNERTAVLHVAFCPPLETIPEIAAEPTDGPDATVRVTQSLQHGTRLEVRLVRSTENPTHVLVDFAANATGGN